MERRHHRRGCGLVFCGGCTEGVALMPPAWRERDPRARLRRCQVRRAAPARWAESRSNATRSNAVADASDSFTRYCNSPLRFTLGGEVRKAAYTLRNLFDGVNFWERDAEYFDQNVAHADALLFVTLAKVASYGFAFGAVVGAEITDVVTPLDRDALGQFMDPSASKLSLGASVSFAFGPLGRAADGEALVSSAGAASSTTSYSQARGFYGGFTVEGAHVYVRDRVNTRFYGRARTPAEILCGTAPPPPRPLYDALDRYYAERVDRYLDDVFERRTTRSSSRDAHSMTFNPRATSDNGATFDPRASREASSGVARLGAGAVGDSLLRPRDRPSTDLSKSFREELVLDDDDEDPFALPEPPRLPSPRPDPDDELGQPEFVEL
ncbi:hypothetical protein JL721_7117 [Aureococcus anophagefferens]|nr:hypothetical protein JL721_7117 [Aureococcus anophagefferens]